MGIGTGAAIVAGAGLAGNIIGGIAGREAGRADAGEARNAMNIAFSELERIGLPPDLSKKIIYEQFQQQGLLTPELEQDILAGPSKLAEIQEDPSLRTAQMEALQILQQRGKTGLNPEDRAALNKIRQEIATDTEAKRQQILSDFAARGQAGTGAELIAALQASQGGANLASQEGDRLAAMSSERAMEAIQRAGELGGQIRGQEFSQESQKAAAQDAIEAFNIANRLGVQQRNVGTRNIAQERNLAEKQRLSELNTAQENQERLRQNEARRQEWLDQLTRAEARSGARMGQAGALQQSAAQASQQAGAPWQAIGSAGAAIGSYLAGREDKKEKKWMGGEVGVSSYNEGGKVESLKDKLSRVLGSRESNPQLPSEESRKVVEDSMRKAFGYNQGGVAYDYRDGGQVPGQAPMPGDHPANDIVPAMLSPGELVIPRSMAKTNFGKKLAKLLEDHHEIRKQLDKNGEDK